LSPVIAIEQKTTNKNPRSTVGTVTELYDFLRLLFARVSDAYSQTTGKKLVSYTEEQILKPSKKIIKAKNHADGACCKIQKRTLPRTFCADGKKGYGQARIDGELQDIEYDLKLDRYKTHDIDIVIDRWIIGNLLPKREWKNLFERRWKWERD
jgi:excinuclease ABC subunit A